MTTATKAPPVKGSRARILEYIAGEFHTPREIEAALGIAYSTVTENLRALVKAGLAKSDGLLDNDSGTLVTAYVAVPQAEVLDDDASAVEVQSSGAVWIAVRRRGITYHDVGAKLTKCGRSMRTGFTLDTAMEAIDAYSAEPCVRCWPPVEVGASDAELDALAANGTAVDKAIVAGLTGKRSGRVPKPRVPLASFARGALRDRILTLVRELPAGASIKPAEVSKLLNSGTGATAACLDREVKKGTLRMVSAQPKAYAAA